jgi:hypothetical protein
MSDTDILTPRFEEVLVADNLKDGYWLQAVDINGDGMPDLVASGLALGHIVWYENPTWRERAIADFPKPVALDHADVDGDGRLDLVVCHDYGNCMYNCRPEDGKISWLRNPGSFESDNGWDVHFIADLMATHRLRFGRFTREDNLQLLALPVVGPEGVHEPVRATLYPRPEEVLGADEWAGELVDDTSFRIIHDVLVDKFGSRSGSDLDSVLLASEEGITWFYYDPTENEWHKAHLGSGELGQSQTTGFKGTGNVALGRIGGDPYAYIATVEPFHGNTVAVYSKDAGSALTDVTWKRTILDVFGDPNEAGEGPGHHVVTADFDGDGDDEFLVALRGPMPWQGVFYYKAIDVKNGLFVKARVSSSSAARIAVADFDGDGRLDFATTGYYTPGYFLADNPQILVFLNRFADSSVERED